MTEFNLSTETQSTPPPEMPEEGRRRRRTNGIETRPAVAQMLVPEGAESLASSIPDSTATASEQPTKRKYTKRQHVNSDVDPLQEDKRYQEAITRMSSLGISSTVKTAFKATGKPLDTEEAQEFDDVAYVMSKRYKLDPSGSPILMAVYVILLLAKAIGLRVMNLNNADIWSHFDGLFGKKEEEKEAEN